jgi:hypothetical protein
MRNCRQNTASQRLSRLDSVGRRTASLLALTLALAALGLSACGSGGGADLLPGETAAEITSNLDQVRELVAAHECIGAEEATREVSDQIGALGGVDQRLKQALREGANRLSLVVEECEEVTEEETEPAVETAIEPEDEAAQDEKAKPQKPEKEKPEGEAAEEAEAETPTLPPQAEGKAKGHEKETAPPAAAETGGGTSAGGVGPGIEAGGE